MNNLGYGTLSSGYNNLNKAALREAFRQGVKHLDTAYSYQDSETMLSSVIKEQKVERNSIELTTKVMPVLSFNKKVETSLKRLKVDYVDNLLIHWPTGDEKLLYSILKDMEKLQESEKVLSIGLSNFPLDLTQKINQDFDIKVIQRCLSLLWIKNIDKEIEYCKTRGIRVQTYSPLASSLLIKEAESSYINNKELYGKIISTLDLIGQKMNATRAQVALAFVASYEIDTVFFSSNNVSNLKTNLNVLTLDKEDLAILKTLAFDLDKYNLSDNFYKHEW